MSQFHKSHIHLLPEKSLALHHTTYKQESFFWFGPCRAMVEGQWFNSQSQQFITMRSELSSSIWKLWIFTASPHTRFLGCQEELTFLNPWSASPRVGWWVGLAEWLDQSLTGWSGCIIYTEWTQVTATSSHHPHQDSSLPLGCIDPEWDLQYVQQLEMTATTNYIEKVEWVATWKTH
jgi:hypothetical protein